MRGRDAHATQNAPSICIYRSQTRRNRAVLSWRGRPALASLNRPLVVSPDPPKSYDVDCWFGLQMFAAMLFTNPTKASAQPPIAKYMNTPGIAEITGAEVVSARR